MKKVIFSVFVLFSFLNSATLLEYDAVENDNDVVLKLFFDSAFEGGIFEKKDKDNLIIILENTQTNEKFTNQLNSNIIKEFVIQNNKNNAEISIKGSPNLETNASILQDGLELNVKFTNKIVNNTSKVLKDLGASKIEHWDARNENRVNRKSIPQDVECVVMLTSFLNHNTMKKIKSDVKKRKIPLVCAKRSVSCVFCEFCKIFNLNKEFCSQTGC